MTKPVVLCAMCDEPGSFCLGCRNIIYCSRSCQEADWPTHKIFCKKLHGHSEAPYPQCERAIYFPNNGKNPFFIWLAYETEKHENGEKYQKPQFSHLLGNATDATTKTLTVNPRLNRNLSHTIVFSNRDTSEIDGSEVNEAVAAVSNLEAAINWKGPVVVYGVKGVDGNLQTLDSLDTADFRHIVDYLETYTGNALACEEPHDGETVTGVRINCLGDRHTENKPAFEEVQVPVTHAVFTCPAAPITERIGIPIRAIKGPTNPAWREEFFDGIGLDHRSTGTTNSRATYLHLDCNSASNDFGWAPSYWQNKVGNVIAVRADKQPLLVGHLDAITRYCQFIVNEHVGSYRETIAHYKELKGDDGAKIRAAETQLMAQISKERFKTYYEDWRTCQDEWEKLELVSPYEVGGNVDGLEGLPELSLGTSEGVAGASKVTADVED